MRSSSQVEPSNQDLIQECLAGSEEAWPLLVQRFARLVHSVPARHGLDPMEIEDIAQETFLALARNLTTIEHPERLAGWLQVTARRLCWRRLQKRQREETYSDLPGGEDPGEQRWSSSVAYPSIEELIEAQQKQEALARGLNRLDDRCRRLLHLLFLEPDKPSYALISERLSMPVGSIGPNRNRCLERLGDILNGLGFFGEDL